jgi:phenylalanyl-tRNA synthetase beta chain
MRLLLSWLRDFVDVGASADDLADRLGLRGFEVASIEALPDGDAVIDLEITANRPDCLSVLGLAREVATLYDRPLGLPSPAADARVQLQPHEVGSSDRLKVTIDRSDLCPRYAAAVAEVAAGQSPAWMAARLQAAGVRPINAVVDITNYVLIELGHPTHAFDLERLAGAEILVRRARPGEALTTLDGVERRLDVEMLLIADRDRPQAIAGVMGGARAEVSPSTKLVAFESAYFQPASVRRTSKRLALKTEASARFERGADIGAPVLALQRIEALLNQIGAGRMVGPFVDVYPAPRESVRLQLRASRLAAVLGVEVPRAEVERILGALGLSVTRDGDRWNVVAPTFRVDLLREVDLIEEVGRHYGFDKLPSTLPAVVLPAPPPDPAIPRDALVRRVLTAAGLSEAVTFGFIEAKAAAPFAIGESAAAPVAISNPLSAKFDTLRPLLTPGLVDVVAHNRRRGREDVGIFELGTRFSAAGETRAVAMAWTGSATPLHWSGGSRPVDFFDAKGAVEALAEALGATVEFQTAHQPFLAAGQAATIAGAGDATLGFVGRLAPAIADARGLPRQDPLFVAELDLDGLIALRADTREATRSLPRHPFVVRDLSIAVDDTLPAATIRGTIQAAARAAAAPLVDVRFFDRYQGKGVADQRVSVSVRLTFQAADRTLTDDEVQQGFDAILSALVREHDAVQR